MARDGRTRLSPRAKKAWLTVHIAVSVGWLGSAYTAFVVAMFAHGANDADVQRVGHDLLHRFDLAVMRPFGLAALVTGIVVAVGSRWGLFQRYWVVAKLGLTLLLMLFGILFQSQWIDRAATMTGRLAAAVMTHLPAAQIVAGTMLAMAILALTTALSVYKPWGTIRRPRPR